MKSLISLAVILFLAGCGGENSSNDETKTAYKPAVVQGSIQSISGNTVTVNGHSYIVASVTFNNVSLSVSELQPNMKITISSSSAAGTSFYNEGGDKNPHSSGTNHAELNPTLTGLIGDINHTTGSFTVNGIELSFPNLSPEIKVGDWVMVSSLPAADSGYTVLSVVAFEQADLIGHIEVEGLVNNLTDTNFTLGNLIAVDYSGAVVEDNVVLQNGLWVEVNGSMNGAVLVATEVEVESDINLGHDIEIEGRITWVDQNLTSFELNHQVRFEVNSSTRFDDGRQQDLKLGRLVEVTSKQQNNQNIAVEIEFDDDNDNNWMNNDIEFEGRVISVDNTTLSFVIEAMNGAQTTIYTNHRTLYEDRLTFGTLYNQRIEVEAYKVNGQYIATEIESDID